QEERWRREPKGAAAREELGSALLRQVAHPEIRAGQRITEAALEAARRHTRQEAANPGDVRQRLRRDQRWLEVRLRDPEVLVQGFTHSSPDTVGGHTKSSGRGPLRRGARAGFQSIRRA